MTDKNCKIFYESWVKSALYLKALRNLQQIIGPFVPHWLFFIWWTELRQEHFSKALLFFKSANLYISTRGYWRHRCDLKARIIRYMCLRLCLSAFNKQWHTADCVSVTSASQNNSQAIWFLFQNKYKVVFGDPEISFIVIYGLFRFGKDQKDKRAHRTSNEQQRHATILRSVKITVTPSPGPTHGNTVIEKATHLQTSWASRLCLFCFLFLFSKNVKDGGDLIPFKLNDKFANRFEATVKHILVVSIWEDVPIS